MPTRSSLTLALVLLGCTPEGRGSGACDSRAADDFIDELLAIDVHERRRWIEAQLSAGSAPCRPTLLYDYGDHDFGLTEAGKAAFDRACIAGSAALESIGRDPDRLYDRCGFARLRVMSRDEYRQQPRADPFDWALYQWFVDEGLRADQARAIVRAYMLGERERLVRRPGLRLPAIEGEGDLIESLVVQVLANEIADADESLAGFEELREGEVLPDHAISAYVELLEVHESKGRAILESRGEVWTGRLSLAVDAAIPRSVLVDLVEIARGHGFVEIVQIVEPRPFDYAIVWLVGRPRAP
ncbi:hypothetical protein ACNOYE_25105 [Nannocystaceae bacterium ST9]